MPALLLIAFFLSGAAGLTYESIWSRYLGLFLGHGAYAQVAVLVVFLGGLALGSLLVGQRSERLKHPLLWYAVAELVVGLFGLVFHDLYVGMSSLAFGSILPPLAGGPLLTPVRWLLAGALILPPSVLLGTTFPLMSAALIRMRPAEPGHTLAMLYFTNSLGAAVGVLVAGFVLIAWAGLPGTLLAAAVLNILVALMAWAVWRQTMEPGTAGAGGALEEPDAGAASAAPVSSEFTAGPVKPEVSSENTRLWRMLLAVSFGTAVASFIYEIAWIRMLTLVLGAATHSFELMLSAFILGLASGALWVRRRADSFVRPMRALGLIQWAMGLSAVATLPLYAGSFAWTEWLLEALATSDGGYAIFTLGRYSLALIIMLPATFFAGMTLPLITRVLMTAVAGERAIGWVYGLNTLGSIFGVAAASLVLLPVLGLKGLLVLGAGLDMLLGVYILFALGEGGPARDKRLPTLTAAVSLVAVVLVLAGVRLDQNVLSSGVYRRESVVDSEVLFWQDGRTATVSVKRRDGVTFISTNGKVDASLGRGFMGGDSLGEPAPLQVDEPTQALLALVTLAHRPDARIGAVVGQGSGLSSQMLLGSPVLEELQTIEIEPAMIEGSRLFYPANARVFDDPRSSFVVDDARAYLATSDRRFDVIVSEPSNPWVSGVASLFTQEFYATVAASLSEGGVFGQWIQLYALDDALVLGILAALERSFPSFSLYRVGEQDMLIVAGTGPSLPDPDWRVFRYPGVEEDLRRTHRFTDEALDRLEFMNEAALRPLLETWAYPNSDFYPTLDLSGERAQFMGQSPDGFLAASSPRFDPGDAFLEPHPELDPVGFPIPVVGIPAMRNLALTTEFNRVLGGGAVNDGTWYRVQLARGLQDYRALMNELDEGDPPADWWVWTGDVLALADLLQAERIGVVDEALYETVQEYLETHDAPEGARAAVAFQRALRLRDWTAVAAATDVLVEELWSGTEWIAPDLLRDAGVTARLRSGDAEGARALYRELTPGVARSPEDLRTRLLVSYLEEGDARR